ncbi:enoyl-CoA hydratase/isomerase family protein [Nocardia abscessus]|jgi:2-(1,2-epoxy-1,2-dihydrophenyl)acetyl-CoA isomerase|uniref:enoyl-CoA hydratase/isomerase family protein n=1 Tax=Nocardia TaxID=1817 RepID=UPI0018932E04|nr:enoyl-CoA hydratase-related protein [Nocardia abscessus]MBF6207396.1 enoyl-CoA hydratase/isomerase family protein [Streptomyces gardneri]MBF6472433.1 enoyl-CoA hydratase/isomerase family protein [Nocardia abscessus]
MTDVTAELEVERRADILWITLDRPTRRNALTVDLVEAIGDALAEADRAGDIRAAVLTGAGSAFCAGGDLPSLAAVAEGGPRSATDAIYSRFHRMVGLLGSVAFPVIAAVNGPAMGAGLDLAMACDLRIASAEARFASSWINVGLVPGMGGAHLLTRAIGSTRAAELVLLGRTIDAATAHSWGLVNSVVAPEELHTEAESVATRLAGFSRPAVQSSKASLRRAGLSAFDAELAALGAVQGGLLVGDDFRAATAAMTRGAR